MTTLKKSKQQDEDIAEEVDDEEIESAENVATEDEDGYDNNEPLATTGTPGAHDFELGILHTADDAKKWFKSHPKESAICVSPSLNRKTCKTLAQALAYFEVGK